jgi:hypothetical protein
MSIYCILAHRSSQNGGFDVTIGGPGIPPNGIDYWFDRKDEANSLVKNLNVLYADAKQLAKWRESRARKRIIRVASNSRSCAAVS